MEQPSTEQRPTRILHVLGRMDRNGIATWLMEILRYIDRAQFRIDFLVEPTPGAYDDEIRALGSRIIPCDQLQRPWLHPLAIANILRRYGPYDIVHCHERPYSSFVLPIAHGIGIPVRVAHSHNGISTALIRAGLAGSLYVNLSSWLVARHSTVGLAVSKQAAAAQFGPSWGETRRCQILNCGFSLDPFERAVEPAAVRAELGIPQDAFVIGHVGRFAEQKNHRFLVEIGAEVAARAPQVRLLLVGDGPLHPVIKAQVASRGLDDRVIFVRASADVGRLMRGAMDAFLFPSLFEGMGTALVEAQAAALPCVIAEGLPDEVDVVPPLIRRLSLGQPPSVWADTVLATREALPMPEREALAFVRGGRFDIGTSWRELERLYTGNLSPRRMVSRVEDGAARAMSSRAG